MASLLAAITFPDAVVLGVCALVGIRGAIKGFAWQAVRTVGLIGYDPFGQWLDRTFSFVPEDAAPALAWILILIGIFLLFSFLAHMARGAVKTVSLTSYDRLFGLVLGIVMGLTLCAIGFVVWGHVVGEDELGETLDGSKSAHYMAHTVDVLDPLFPDSVRERFHKSLKALDAAAE